MWSWLLMLVISPVLEEVIFRLGVQTTLMRRWPHGPMANVLTATLFALSHWLLSPQWLSAATALPALWLGHLFQRHRNIGWCIGLHAAMNLCWLLATGPLHPLISFD